MFWNKQKLKLVTSISVLLISGFLVTSFASYYVSRASLRSEIAQNELPLTSDNIYSEIQQDLLRPIFISSLMASDTFLRDWVIDGETKEKQIIRYLKEIKTKYNTVTSFFVSEKTRIYYHADGILKKVSANDERDTWYFRVKDMKEPYETNIDIDLANSDTMTVFINYKVFDYTGNYIGATGVGLTVSAFIQMLEKYQNKYNRTIYFIDNQGNIKLSGSGFNNTIERLSHLENNLILKQQSILKKERSSTYKKKGAVVHTYIRYIKEFEWFLVVEQPELETIKHIYKMLLINLCICICITIIVLTLVNFSVTRYQKRIETLRGIVPICSYCKQIRDDKGYWNLVETYVEKHTDAQFSHSICPTCMEQEFPEINKSIKKKKRGGNIGT